MGRKLIRFRKMLRVLLYGKGRNDHWLLMILSAAVGVVCGFGAIAFYLGIDLVIGLVFGGGERNLATTAANLPWWHILGALTIGGLVVGQLLRLLTNHKPYGVSQVMEAAALNNGQMPFRQGIITAGITVTSLGVGGSGGREGPVVHLGATLASFITRWLHLPPGIARTLLGCGVASAVAASFNAPFAGVFFALEVIIGHYALHVLTPIVIAAIIGTIISRLHLGDLPIFTLPDYAITSYAEFPAFFILGLVCCVGAIVFMKGLEKGEKFRDSKIRYLPYWIRPALGGLLVGTIALWLPEVLSVGYEAKSNALNGNYDLSLLLILVVAKMVATIITLGSGFGGGVFSPSLFIGAMIGGAFGILASMLFPDLASNPGVYAIVGMGAMASAVLGAPISTMLIVFELTGDYSITIAVMIASSVASLFTTNLYRHSFFHIQLANKGLHLEGGKASYLLKSAKVSDHLSRDFFTINQHDTIYNAREMLIAQEGGKIIVTNNDGAMVGIATLGCLPHETDFDSNEILSVCDRDPVLIYACDTMERALNRFSISGETHIAVLESRENQTVVGLLAHKDVMDEYNKALLERQGQDK